MTEPRVSPTDVPASNIPRGVEPPVTTAGWAKALLVGVVVYFASSIALAFVGVPYFGLFGYAIGAVAVGRITYARTWRRWVAAFALMFVLVVCIGIAAIGVLTAARGA
jgi:O-antigen/teichoic acid export membrane protein